MRQQIEKARDHAREAVHKLLPSVKKSRSELYWMLAYALVPTVLLGAAVRIWVQDADLLQDLRSRVFDTYQRIKPRQYLVVNEDGSEGPPPVRIIDLDDQSLAKCGQWPWPRTLVARLVQRLNEAGAGVIAFDAVFSEPDRTSPAQLAQGLSGASGLEDLKARLKRLPDHDRVLAEAFAQASVVTGFSLVQAANPVRPAVKRGFLFSSARKDSAQLTAEDLALGEEHIKRKMAQNQGDLQEKDPKSYLPEYYGGAVNNLPVLEAAAAGNGNFSILPDRDGIIRRVPLMYRLGEDVYPSLALEALRLALGGGGYKVTATGGHQSKLEWGDWNGIVDLVVARKDLQFEIPTDAQGNVTLYDTGHLPERFVPAWKVLDGSAGRKELEGTIAFIGTSAAGLQDIRATPLNQVTPGVEVHAQLVEQALSREFLKRPAWSKPLEFSFLLVFGLALILLMSRLGAAWCALIAGGGIGAALGLSWYAFSRHHLLLDPVYPALVVLAIYLATSLINYLRSEAEKAWVRDAFSKYMSPELVEQLAEDPSKLKLGGETRELTVMFSDIRSFTTISEQFDAHGLTQFINRYLTPMTEIVLEHKGFIDKYIGDCIMAFWNAPLDDKEHAANGCRSALKMRSSLKSLNEEWRLIAEAEGRKHIPIKTGIGVNTGPCCVGNLGSEQKFGYSTLGDDVNLSSRLEGQSKYYAVDIIIGENTRAKTPGFAALELDLIRVKGKTVPVRIFTLLGDEDEAKSPAFLELAAKHAAVLEAYRAQKWDEAGALMDETRKLAPHLNGLYDLYSHRIEDFKAAPPPKDWDGVFTATSK